MSKPYNTEITCPSCGEKSEFTIWESVNTSLDPKMKRAVRDGSAFRFVCPHCGQARFVDYGFLYHQMEDRILIHYARSDENAQEIIDLLAAKGPFRSVATKFYRHGYMIRIVRSMDELLEKLAIIDAGLDDRLVELYKLFLRASLQNRQPEKANSDIRFCRDGDRYLLRLHSNSESLDCAEFSMGTYELIRDQFAPALPEEDVQEPIVNLQWSVGFLKSQEA